MVGICFTQASEKKLSENVDRQMDDGYIVYIISLPMSLNGSGELKKKQEAHGPRFARLSDSHCRHADVMQHFSNPIIVTNENIII